MERSPSVVTNFPLQTLAIVVFVMNALAGTALAEPASFEPARAWSDNTRPTYPHPHGFVTHRPATVTVRFVVDRHGAVVDPAIVEGAEPFASASLRAVKRWRYEPARENGQVIPSAQEIRFRFELPPRERDRWASYRREPRPGSAATAMGAVAASSR